MLSQIFENFNKLRVLIIGDVMVDAYDWGKVERISPEAPVPVVSLTKKEFRLGGAANVAQNILAMGATPVMCAVIGNDVEGEEFLKLLETYGMTSEAIVKSKTRITTTKRRVIAGSQHLLRIDSEHTDYLSKDDEQNLTKLILNQLEKVDVVIFEDYDKGLINQELIKKVVAYCQDKNVPIAVDPKKRNFLYYKGVTLFKPNLKELREGLRLDSNLKSNEELEHAVSLLDQELKAEKYLITLSERGVFIKSALGLNYADAHLREIADVSGAGDTVIAVASLCLALKLEDKFIAGLSNLAGGLVCEHVGAVPINKKELFKEANLLF